VYRPAATARSRAATTASPYKARHLIENFFARLKQYRAIATRHNKTARNFLGGSIGQPPSSGLIDDTP
jgi:transposase